MTLLVRPNRTRRQCDVFSTFATNKDVRKTYVRPKLGRPLDVRGRLAEWVDTRQSKRKGNRV